MLEGEALREALRTLPLLPFTGTFYRLIHAKYAETALSSVGSLRYGGRYNPSRAFEVLYLADSPVTGLQEVNVLFRTDSGLLPVRGAPRIVLSVDCRLSGVFDLREERVQQALGTNPQELTGMWVTSTPEAPAPTQRLGLSLYEHGEVEAVLAPSARGPGATNLAVFPDRLKETSLLRVYDEEGVIDAKLP